MVGLLKRAPESNKREFYRRHLPHWQPTGAPLFITWRLHGSLPKTAIEQLEREKRWEAQVLSRCANPDEAQKASVESVRRRFRLVEKALDSAASGPLWLNNAAIADIVVQSLRDSSEKLHLYDLLSYCVMPNHVHVLIDPKADLERITKSIKGFTARKANRILNREGEPFWQDESFDRWMRNDGELLRTIRYIENNPVKSGLAANPEDWPWSSAAPR